MTAFTEQFTLSIPVEEARPQLIAKMTPLLQRRGFTLISQGELSLTYEYRYCPPLCRVAGVLLFWTIVGIGFFFVKRTDRILLSLQPEGNVTRVTATGQAAGSVARAFRDLAD